MSAARAKSYLSGQVSVHAQSDPQVLQFFTSMKDFYEKKLWHQLTLKLEEFVKHPFWNGKEAEIVELYETFVKDFEGRINQLSFARISISITRQLKDPAKKFEFLEKISAKVSPSEEKEAYSLLLSEMAWVKLNMNQLEEAKKIADKVGQTLEGITGAEFEVYSSYYRVLAVYYKTIVSPSEFYRNSLMYLLYTPLENLSQAERSSLAFDMGIAALVSKDIHNFGELLAHPVLDSLDNTPNAWLKPFLFAFNAGDLEKFEQYLHSHKAQLEAQPALQSNATLLREKISILALMELVFNKPSEGRTLPFADVAQATRLKEDQVEMLVMKALSLKLIRGELDEVSRTVTITWVQSRVLDLNQVKKIRERMGDWIGGVKNVLTYMENETAPELLA